MLPALNKEDTFLLNKEYRLIEVDNRCYLQDTVSKGRIETDEIGRMILESSPFSFASLVKTLNKNDVYLSSKLIRYYLLLFWKSGVIKKKTDELPQKNSQGREVPGKSSISVVIVTYNGERFISENLESLYRQTMAPHEIIIVDNASDDRTLNIVEKDFKDVYIIKNSKNYHYAKAVNIGVEKAAGESVVILNQDIVLKEDFIEMLYRRYQEEKKKEEIAGLVPQIRFNKQRNFINGIGNFVTEKNWGSDNYFGTVDIGQFENLAYLGSACFGAIMVTKRGWAEVGPLDELYKSFYEDVDWSIRVHLKGLKLLAAPKAIVFHEFGGSYPSGIKLFFIVKNRMRFALKNLKGNLVKKFFKIYLKQDIRNCIAFIRGKSFKNFLYYIKAYLHILIEFPKILVQKSSTNKIDIEKIHDFFKKGVPYVVLSNNELNPVINKDVIRRYYYFSEIENFNYPEDPIVY
jgi:GT2 family glycosyltransferase